jgi:hypothetical protein
MVDIKQLEKRLKGAVFRKRLLLVLSGVIALTSSILGIGIILSLLAALFIIPVPLKIITLLGAVILMAFALYRSLIKSLIQEKGINSAALEMEKRHPELKGRLIAALQFSHFDSSRTNFSSALIELTRRQALELTSSLNFNEIISGYPLIKRLRSGLGVTALAVIFGLLIPGFFSNGFEVYSQPTTRVAPPPGFSLEVDPGNAESVKYSDIEIGGRLIGSGFPANIEIFYRFSDGRWQSEKLKVTGQDRSPLNNSNGGSLNGEFPFKITLKQVRRSFDYYILAGDIVSEKYAINIVERPRVNKLKVTVNYPSYTGLRPMVLDEDNGSFAALVGSRATLEIEANRAIQKAYLIINDTLEKDIDFKESQGETSLYIENDLAYYIRLFDESNEENPDPIEYLITAIPDEYPIIDVVFPGFDLNLDETMMIPFVLQLSDDFGFTSLALKYMVVSGGQRSPENVAIINLPENITTQGEVSFNWDLEGFNLLPSDYVLYHFELADNDRVSGPKISHTRVYAARLPSIDEIVMEIESQQSGKVLESEQVLQQQRELVRKMERLAQELKQTDKLDWQKQEELENIVEQQDRLAEQLEKMSQEMKKSLESAERNNILSEQIITKLMELQKLFNEVATPEMKEAIKKMQEALSQMSQEEIEKAMKQFQISQEEMLARLERSVELLRKMQIEQKMSAMLKMAEEMLLEQNRVNVETEEARNDNAYRRLTQREKQLQKQMTALKNEADKLSELLRDSPLAQSQGHQDFTESVQQNQAEIDMAAMEAALDEQKQDAALDHGQQSSKKLAEMVNKMRDLINMLSDQEGKELAQQMRRALDDANYLSHEQEKLHGQCRRPLLMPSAIGELAAQQQILREAIGGLIQRLNEISRRSPFMATEVLSNLLESRDQMSGACDQLGEQRARTSLDFQKNAVYNLNKASIRLLDAIQNQKQCNSNNSCNKPGMNLESLCQKQSQINRETKASCPKPGQNPTPSQKQAMGRLAGEQGAVRKSLEELQAEFGNRREILGRLDALSREIKEIEEMLADGQGGQELQNRQLRIYSRMLDLQKSLSRRDYTRERQATTAEDILKASPGPLDEGKGNAVETLQDRLSRYLQEGYPRQYEQQIKAYFKSISNMSNENSVDQ